MKTQHLNYCRQYLNWCDEHDPEGDPNDQTLKVIEQSQKFILPDFGVTTDDRTYKALHSTDVIRLPFNSICLEFAYYDNKVILVCVQNDDEDIIVIPIIYAHGKWERNVPAVCIHTNRKEVVQGTLGLFVTVENVKLSEFNEKLKRWVLHSTYRPLIGLLNILACSNVSLEKSEPPKLKARNGIKGRRPFDTYHILVINANKKSGKSGGNGGHQSPREHLRRGHIRRLEDKSIWVNACVVSAGHGPKIDKAYKVIA